MGLDWHTVLSNRDTYPDDVKFQFNGEEVTLGELRKGHDQRIADLTPREMRAAEKERQIQAREAQVREAMATLANRPPAAGNDTPTGAPPMGYTWEQWNAIQQDPYMAPVLRAMNFMAEKLKSVDDTLTKKQAEERQNRINWRLHEIAQKDKRYQDEGERQALLAEAGRLVNEYNLEPIYYYRHREEFEKQAEERGYERGKKEGSRTVPNVPYGTRPIMPVEKPTPLPERFETFVEQKANDPDLIQAVREAAIGPGG